MTIPDYQTVMLPILKHLSNQQEYRARDLIEPISDMFGLSDDEKRELLPSGKQRIIDNRIGWARTYLKKAGLLEDPRRGYTKITDRGLEVLGRNLQKINVKFLEEFPEFIEFRSIRKNQDNADSSNVANIVEEEIEDVTPDELMEKGYELIKTNLGQELLNKLRKNSPSFFENVVLELLSSMGYGEGKVTGHSGDGGIDGVVYQDKLGIDKIFFQAKRFDEKNAVSASMVRDFVGALDLNGVNKGVFITTSKFPKNSEDLVSRSHKSIKLVDGRYLVQLMIDHDLGVDTEKIYKIKRIDSDFFPEE